MGLSVCRGNEVEQPHEAWPIVEHEPENEPTVPPDLNVGLSVCLPVTCSAHPDRPAVSQNDMRTSAMCAECYEEWLKLWKGMQ